MNLFLIFAIFFAFFIIGGKVSRVWRQRFSTTAESVIICTGLGLILVTLLTTGLVFLRWFYPVTPWMILGTVYLFGRDTIIGLLRRGFTGLKISPRHWKNFTWFDRFNLALLGCLIFLALTLAQTPASQTDALVYHLAVPKTYLENHGVTILPNNIYSFFPMQVEMLYLFCLSLHGEVLAQLGGLGISFLLLFALTQYYRQTFSARLALFVPVLYFSTFTFFFTAPAAYVDLPVAAFTFLTYYAWDRWRQEHQNGWFYTMVVFAGAAVASKLTAVIVLPLVFLGIVWEGRKVKNAAWVLKKTLLFSFGALVFLLPWWGRNYSATGNPFVPYMMQFFGGEQGINWDVSRSLLQLQYYKAFGMGHGLSDFFLLPYRLTFSSAIDSLRFDGKIGILFIVLLPTLFWMKKRCLPMAMVFLILILFWFIHFQYIRLLTPAFAFLSILCVACLANMTEKKNRLHASPRFQAFQDGLHAAGRALIFLSALGAIYNLGSIAREWFHRNPLPYLLHWESKDQYLTRQIDSYPLFHTVNTQTDRDAKILFIYMRNFGFLSERKFISDTFFEAHTIQQILKRDPSSDGISRQLNDLGVTHLLFDDCYVFGKNSALPPGGREAFKGFLSSRAQMVQEKNGYYLYRFMIN